MFGDFNADYAKTRLQSRDLSNCIKDIDGHSQQRNKEGKRNVNMLASRNTVHLAGSWVDPNNEEAIKAQGKYEAEELYHNFQEEGINHAIK